MNSMVSQFVYLSSNLDVSRAAFSKKQFATRIEQLSEHE